MIHEQSYLPLIMIYNGLLDHSANIGEIRANRLKLGFIYTCVRVFLSRVDASVKCEILSVFIEDVCMRRSSESEHSKQLSFLNALAFLYVVHNARHLNHADFNNGHSPDLGVIGFDHIDLSYRTHSQKRLASNIAVCKLNGKTRIASIVSISDFIASLNNPTNRRSPSMVAPGIQETLVDSSILKSVSEVGLLFRF